MSGGASRPVCTALDYPRRCCSCGVRISACMGFVLARDMLPVLARLVTGVPAPLVKVRELCGRCVFVWNAIAEQYES